MFYPGPEGETVPAASADPDRARHKRGSGPADIHVILGSVRPIQLKRLLRDLTAFSVKSVTVARAMLSEASYFHASMWEPERLRGLLVEGAMQGGHTRLPELSRVSSVAEAIAVYDDRPDMLRVYLDDAGRPAGALRARRGGEPTVIAVGPERGFTQAEKETLDTCAFEPVGIPGGILRAETAAIAGVAAIRSCVPGNESARDS
ncbi:MAG: RsmE family RNA methyltransferase [Spirochaetota bacterium]